MDKKKKLLLYNWLNSGGGVTPVAPTVQALNIVLDNTVSGSIGISWTNGNGANRIVVVYPSAVYTAPTDGNSYTANSVYGSGYAIGAGYVVYSGTGSSVTVTGITPGTTYYVKVFEANGTVYNTTASTNNPVSFAATQTFAQRVVADGGLFESQTGYDAITAALGSNFAASSFVLTPNGFKTGKIYASKPTDGSGDLTFSRSTVGWRKSETALQEMQVDVPRYTYLQQTIPNLLLEPARTSIMLQSQGLSNAAFTKLNVTVSADAGTTAALAVANGVWVEGNYCYVVSYTSDALNIFDITNPGAPQMVSRLVDAANLNGAVGVEKVGNYLFVSCQNGDRITSIDVSNILAPVVADTILDGEGGASLSGPWNFKIRNGLLYVGTNNAIEIIDISVPTAMTHVGKIVDGGAALLNVVTNVDLDDNGVLYAAVFVDDALQLINVSNPASPTALGNIVHNGTTVLLDKAHGVNVINNRYAIVAARDSNSMVTIDCINPNSPAYVSKLVDGDGGCNIEGAENFMIVGNIAYVCAWAGDGFQILDYTDPTAPLVLGQINNGTDGAALDAANRVFVSGSYAYIASNDSNALEVIFIGDRNNPRHVAKVVDTQVKFYRMVETVTNGLHLFRQVFTKAASSLSYIAAIRMRGGLNRDYFCLQLDDNTNAAGKFFNVTTGALGNDRIVGSGFAIQESRIIDLGGGEYLCLIRVTTTASATLQFTVLYSTDGTTVSYAGNVLNGFYGYSAKLIQSASPLTDSYIQTVASSVARTVDTVAPKTGVSSLIGQTQGTIFFWVKGSWADSVSKAISISDGTANNRIMIDFTTGNLINALVVSGGVTQATISNAGFVNLTEYKVAVTYQSNKAALFVNGTKIGEDLTVTVPACSRIGFDSGAGSNPFYGNIEAFTLSATALSDADAQTLTTI